MLSDIQVYFKSVLEFSHKEFIYDYSELFTCANGNEKKVSVFLCFNAFGRHTIN